MAAEGRSSSLIGRIRFFAVSKVQSGTSCFADTDRFPFVCLCHHVTLGVLFHQVAAGSTPVLPVRLTDLSSWVGEKKDSQLQSVKKKKKKKPSLDGEEASVIEETGVWGSGGRG